MTTLTLIPASTNPVVSCLPEALSGTFDYTISRDPLGTRWLTLKRGTWSLALADQDATIGPQ